MPDPSRAPVAVQPHGKQWWRDRIEAAQGSPAQLKQIGEELRGLPDPWAGPLRIHSIALLTRARAAGTVRMLPFMPEPDGSPLYRHKPPSDGFEGVRLRLQAQLGQPSPRLLVWWAANWFRGNWKGGILKWEDLEGALGCKRTQADWRRLVDDGLRAWRLRPLRMGGMTHRLRTLALQGGFPVAALSGGSGWASEFLKRLVGALLAAGPTQPSTAFAHAQALVGHLPQTWRNDDFLQLCTELATDIVRLRQEAGRGGMVGSLAPSQWLDQHCPGWRENLPLPVDEAGARQLVDELMRAPLARAPATPVRATRLLARTPAGWEEQAQLDLHGTLPLGASARDWSRLRLFAADGLVRHIPGELGAAEADGKDWLATPSVAGARTHAVPFAVPIAIEAHGNGQRVSGPHELPHGQALQGPFLVCRLPDDADSGTADVEDEADNEAPTAIAPRLLTVLSASGGGFRADPVFVLAGDGWTAAGAGEDSRVKRMDQADGKALWRVSGAAVLQGPDGDRYAVNSRQDAEKRHNLILEPGCPAFAARLHSPEAALSWGVPRLLIRAPDGGLRTATLAATDWRPSGERNWRPTLGFDGLGPCEFGLRGDGGLRLDRQTCLVLPRGFQATAERAEGGILLRVSGWPGVYHVDGAEPAGNAWWLPEGSGGRSFARLRLSASGMKPAVLLMRLPQRAAIADWDGVAMPLGQRLGLADLAGLVARSDGEGRLHAELRDGQNRPVAQAGLDWMFHDELPLGSVRGDMAALLRSAGELDAWVRLSLTVSDRFWRVGEFAIEVPGVGEAALPGLLAAAKPGDRLAARRMHDPAAELDVTPPGLGDDPGGSGAQPAALLPPGCSLVFLRRGGRVASRPLLLGHAAGGEAGGGAAPGKLAAAMSLPFRRDRLAALEAMCAETGGDGGGADALLADIARLAMGLDGLPPSTFDVLAALPRHPGLLVRLLFASPEADVPRILALADGLPFAWPLIARAHWDAAADGMGDVILHHLPDSMAIAAGAVSSRKKAIADAEPALAPILGMAKGQPVALRDAMQGFLHANHDERNGSSSPFRPSMDTFLPRLGFDEAYWRVLDAPCAAAYAAKQGCALLPEQIRCVKDVARRHPGFFAQAFAARWKELAYG